MAPADRLRLVSTKRIRTTVAEKNTDMWAVAAREDRKRDRWAMALMERCTADTEEWET